MCERSKCVREVWALTWREGREGGSSQYNQTDDPHRYEYLLEPFRSPVRTHRPLHVPLLGCIRRFLPPCHAQATFQTLIVSCPQPRTGCQLAETVPDTQDEDDDGDGDGGGLGLGLGYNGDGGGGAAAMPASLVALAARLCPELVPAECFCIVSEPGRCVGGR